MLINVHQLIPFTRAEGPGNRFCIQVQGCPIRCDGCAVPQTWPVNAGKTYRTKEIINQISDTQGIEGVTFLGGEPFAQAEALADIANAVREQGLSVVTFTGYRREYLVKEKNAACRALLNATDLLIDGPFRRDLIDFSRPWVGSSNQRFHFLTDRYSAADLTFAANKLEIRFHPDGRIMINGLASDIILNSLLKK